MQKNKGYFIIGIILILMLCLALILTTKPQTKDYDKFAKCLTNKSIKIYGSFLCPHCNEQKKLFGNEWEHIIYIECASSEGLGQSEQCEIANIQYYPTWEFSNQKVVGIKSIQELSKLSGCEI